MLHFRFLAVALMIGVATASPTVAADKEQQAKLNLTFCCSADNDLYAVLAGTGATCPRFDSPTDALAAASPGGGVLVLADGYPDKTTRIDPAVFQTARKKGLRLYVEYPEALPELELGKPSRKQWNRTVVASEAFEPKLEKMRILMIHDCRFLPVEVDNAHLVTARVAGFDTAVYGLPEETWPILFEHPRGEMLVATTKLSQFVTARYAPANAWGAVWEMILGWLQPSQSILKLQWTPTVRPSFGPNEPLPADAQRQAVRRGAAWYEGSRLLVHPSWKDKVTEGPKPGYDRPIGDGRLGILEGNTSHIRHDGTQPTRWLLRADCNGESALPLALQGVVDDDSRAKKIARNLLDFVYFESPLQQGPSDDPTYPSFGLLHWWCTYEKGDGTYYSNDNAKALVATMGAIAALDSDRWDESVLKCLLGHFRTTSPEGYRGVLTEAQLRDKGWRHFSRRSFIQHCPQHTAWIWSCYLWLYDKTKYAPLLERTREAIRLTMAHYPEGWEYRNKQRQMERSRMLLALAWLVRVADTPEHRAWLEQIAGDLIASQDACGAIQEQVAAGLKSNEEYGSREMALIQSDADPVADMLYVMPNALFGLNEAAAATGDAKYARAADKAAEFLVRIQVRSEAHPELDGAWFRAFDFARWDYWAVNGDAGWGTWCTETGWAQSYIVGTLALREMGTSLWDLTADSTIARHFEKWRKRMEIDEAVAIAGEAKPELLAHAAFGRPVTLAHPAHDLYPGVGPAGLTDGRLHDAEHAAGPWMGFRGEDFEATVDLGRRLPVGRVAANFQQSVPIGVFLPLLLEVTVSIDGDEFREVATVTHDVPPREEGPLTKPLTAELNDVEARYVRIRAVNMGLIPEWHHAANRPAWMFVDEVIVQ